jgi:hypothetical protein
METSQKKLLEYFYKHSYVPDSVRYKIESGEFKFVSYHGKAWSRYAVNRRGQIFSGHRNTFLNPHIDSSHGYPTVSLSNFGKPKKMLVHRIMAEAFVPMKNPSREISNEDWANCPQSIKVFIMQNMQVNHIDHDRANYNVENLEWVTSEQNSRKAVEFYNA